MGLIKSMKDYVIYGKGLRTSVGANTQIFTQSTVAKRDGLKGNDLVWARHFLCKSCALLELNHLFVYLFSLYSKQLVQGSAGGIKSIDDEEKILERLLNSDLKVENHVRWPFQNTRLTRDHYQKSVKATIMLVRPKSVGTLKLKSANPLDHPLIDPNYQSHPDDAQAFMEGYVC